MGMRVDISVNGNLIERIDIQRNEPLKEEDKDAIYTYDCRYMRLGSHWTAKGPDNARVEVSHKFSKGSLVLVKKVIEKLKGG